MHELSIVMSIVDIASREAQREGATLIEEIELEIGQLSTIELEAFDFAWQQGIKETPLAHARKIVNSIEGKGRCLDCGLEFPVKELYDACPACGEHFIEILKGKELRVKSLIVR
jgi:hydrogenase nickel incorporation protein HypA/HybF